MILSHMEKGAKFSEDRKYRYLLWRIWDNSQRKAMCIGLNPSTANHENDDNTISILIKVLSSLGYGGFYMTNLYGFISSKPEALSSCPDPVGENDLHLAVTAAMSDEIIFCWGTFKQAAYRAKKVKGLFPNAVCFGVTKNGHPIHPRAMLYASTINAPKLIPFKP